MTSHLFARPKITSKVDVSGAIILSSPHELPSYARCVSDWLVKWAEERPDTVFLGERDASGDNWRKITYGQTLARVVSLAGWLLDNCVDTKRPIAILSENSIDHALLAFAAMHVGIPVATISTAYSLMSTDFKKLKEMIGLLDPSLIYVSSLSAFGSAIDALEDVHNAKLLCSDKISNTSHDAASFSQIGNSNNSDKVTARFLEIKPDDVARLLFTSGSTGTPKAVINTHKMLTSNQEANMVLWPFLQDKPPVIVDWLPWSHTFGCNFTMNMVLRNGGSLYIDDGKPAPPLIGKTARNIKEIRPTMCFNVPRGYEMLIDALAQDKAFRDVFFDMDLIFYAAAALPKTTWDRLVEMSVKTTGKTVPQVAAWGSTETAPLATSCYFQADTTGNIGLPIPGTSLKLVENSGKLEVRVKGPNVTPGYYKLEEKTRQAFDDEGYYIMGDAVRFVDDQAPEKGLYFDGRVSEDFKLSSGTWVSVGELRIAGIDALAPIAQDIVVCGHDCEKIGFLIFPNEAACRKIAGAGDEVSIERVLANDGLLKQLAAAMVKLKIAGGGSSRFAARARFLVAPPNPDAGEITDKAYLNQRQILENRPQELALLQGDDPSAYISI